MTKAIALLGATPSSCHYAYTHHHTKAGESLKINLLTRTIVLLKEKEKTPVILKFWGR
jgi:hypothetical protein